MPKYHQGRYQIMNEAKYAGKGQPTFRSGWERKFMDFCEHSPNVLSWASEPVRIQYINPMTGKLTVYVPDFIVVYLDAKGHKHAELIEIKPLNQSDPQFARSQGQQMQTAVNYAKWEAAEQWSKKRGITFRILTEKDIFVNTKKPKPKKPKRAPIARKR